MGNVNIQLYKCTENCYTCTRVITSMDTLQFDPELYDTIRRNIKRYRMEKGLTSAQLAELVGLSHDFIRQIESPKVRNNFSVDTFYRISVALGTGMDKLAEKN